MKTWRSPEGALALLLLVSATLKLIFFLQLSRTDLVTVPILDSQAYHDWAVQLVSGNPGWGETYWMGPLYPHLLALVYAVFGIGNMAVSALQLLLSLVNIVLVFRLAQDFDPDRNQRWLPVLAAGLYTFYGAPVFYAGVILMATLVTTLYLLVARQLLRAWQRNTLRSWIVLGLLIGVTGLARGNTLLLLLTVPAMILFRAQPFRARRWQHAAAVLLAGLLMLIPTTVRNLVVADDFVILTSNGGINLLIGQNADYKGLFAPVNDVGQADYDFSMEEPLQRELGRDLKGSEVSRILTHRAWDMFRDNLGAMPQHYLLKIYRFWNGYELPQIFSYDHWRHQFWPLRLHFVPYTLLVSLGLLGLWFLPTGQRWILLLLIGTYFLSLLPFFPTSRYRMPMAPLLAVAAAFFLVGLWRLTWARRRTWLLAALLLVAALWPSWASLDEVEVVWQVHLHEASRASKRGDLKTTLAKARLAEEVRPGLGDTSYQLALYLEELEAWPQAEAALQMAAVRTPDSRLVPYRLGVFQDRQGKYPEALESFRQAVAVDPQWSMPWFKAGLTLRKAGQMDDALDALEKAHQLDPGNHQIRSNLASAYASLGRFEAANTLLEELVADYPHYVNGWFNLALVRLRLNDQAGAHEALEQAATLKNLDAEQLQQIQQLESLLNQNNEPGS